MNYDFRKSELCTTFLRFNFIGDYPSPLESTTQTSAACPQNVLVGIKYAQPRTRTPGNSLTGCLGQTCLWLFFYFCIVDYLLTFDSINITLSEQLVENFDIKNDEVVT